MRFINCPDRCLILSRDNRYWLLLRTKLGGETAHLFGDGFVYHLCIDFCGTDIGVAQIVVKFNREPVAICGTMLLLVPHLWIHTSFEGRFKETAIDDDAHIHPRIAVFQRLFSLYVKEDAESGFSLLHIKYQSAN